MNKKIGKIVDEKIKNELITKSQARKRSAQEIEIYMDKLNDLAKEAKKSIDIDKSILTNENAR